MSWWVWVLIDQEEKEEERERERNEKGGGMLKDGLGVLNVVERRTKVDLCGLTRV